MATAENVLKPDFGTRRKHFIFTEEHDQLRESIRRVRDEGAGAARRASGRRRPSPTGSSSAWASSASSASPTPRSTAARAATTTATSCSPRRWRTSNSGGLAMGVAVHTDMATPPVLPVRHRGAEAELPRAGDQGREDLLPRDHRARRRLRRGRHQDARRARRRRVGHQRLEDLHHERPPRRLHRARHEDRPRRGLRRLHALPGGHGPARRDPREEAREARHARLGHRAARVPGRARARGRAARARRARASTTSCGSSRASG